MNKSFALLTYVIFFLFINISSAQDILKDIAEKDTKKDTKTFNIVSLDGKNEKVKIIPDYFNRVLLICCLKDTISITDFWGIPSEVQVLNKKFLEIKYEVRGGSNFGLGNTLIVCINNKRLHESMHVLRHADWDGEKRSHYGITNVFIGNSKANYKLNLSIHDYVNSWNNPEESYNYNNQTVLSFDPKLNVFYNIKKNVNGHFIQKSKKTPKQEVNGNFPVIILGPESYYFINNRWYQLGDSKELFEFK